MLIVLARAPKMSRRSQIAKENILFNSSSSPAPLKRSTYQKRNYYKTVSIYQVKRQAFICFLALSMTSGKSSFPFPRSLMTYIQVVPDVKDFWITQVDTRKKCINTNQVFRGVNGEGELVCCYKQSVHRQRWNPAAKIKTNKQGGDYWWMDLNWKGQTLIYGVAAPICTKAPRTTEQTGTCTSHIQMNITNRKDT